MASIWKTDTAATFAIEGIVSEIMAARRALVASTTAGICQPFQVGKCYKGNSCQYRHQKIEKSVCKHWLRGLCKKNDLCEFLHEYDLTKMPPCHFFLTFGKCSNPECPFLHVKPEDTARDCPWYARGFCKNGPNCKNRHVRSTACAKYLAGFCPDGPKCKFGHAKHEIPSIPDETPTFSASQVRSHYTPDPDRKAAMLAAASAAGSAAIGGVKGETKTSNRPISEVRCFKCGEMGHYANHCTNARKPPPPGGYTVPGTNIPIKDPHRPGAVGPGGAPLRLNPRVVAVAASLGLNAAVLQNSGIDVTLLEGPQGKQIAAQAGLYNPNPNAAAGTGAAAASSFHSQPLGAAMAAGGKPAPKKLQAMEFE